MRRDGSNHLKDAAFIQPAREGPRQRKTQQSNIQGKKAFDSL